MAWARVYGIAGKVYLPEVTNEVPKKHPCHTCFSCQWCDETRCDVCRNENAPPRDLPRLPPRSADDV